MPVSVKASRKREDQRERQRWVNSGRAIRVGGPDHVVLSARERSVRVTAVSSASQVAGTGMIFETGLVITNWHVVEDPRLEQILVNDHPARLIHFDFRYDLAALIAPTRKLRAVVCQTKLRQAQRVFYVGNPEQWYKTVSEGIITKLDRPGRKIYSSTVPAEGFSGSGLYDRESGYLVGLIDSMEGSENNGCNFSVAVPAGLVSEFAREARVISLRRRQSVPSQQRESAPASMAPTKLF